MDYSHVPVLLTEVLEALRVVPNGKYIDGTFGGGGYSIAIAEKGGQVLGLDLDDDALDYFMERTDLSKEIRNRIGLIKANFDSVSEHASRIGFAPVNGVVFDLGVSSFQLDNAQKGFSFMRSGPLDMRMDTSIGVSAGKLLDVLDERSLTELFIKFGDETHSRKIARSIVEARNLAFKKGQSMFWEKKTTTDLASFIEKSIGLPRERIHPATRVFQALRMAVNDEAGNLERGLRSAWDCLAHGGRIVTVSFHSVEDRIVKQFISDSEKNHIGKAVGDIVVPSSEEVARNPRSRSAKMRVIEKL